MAKMHGPGILPRKKGTEATSQLQRHLSLIVTSGSMAADSKQRQNDIKFTSFKKIKKQLYILIPLKTLDLGLVIQNDLYCVIYVVL